MHVYHYRLIMLGLYSETHPKELLNYFSDLSSSKDQLLSFNINNLDDSKLVLSMDIIRYTYKLIEYTRLINLMKLMNYIISKLKNWDLKGLL